MKLQKCEPGSQQKWLSYHVFQVILNILILSEFFINRFLFSHLDEIKHLIGSETTRQGVVRVFDLLQNPILNRRLVYVFVEEIVDTLFPEQNMSEFFQKLHSSAPLK